MNKKVTNSKQLEERYHPLLILIKPKLRRALMQKFVELMQENGSFRCIHELTNKFISVKTINKFEKVLKNRAMISVKHQLLRKFR